MGGPGQVEAVQQAEAGHQLHEVAGLSLGAVCSLQAEGSPWHHPRLEMRRAHEGVESAGRSTEAADRLTLYMVGRTQLWSAERSLILAKKGRDE